MVCPKCGSPVAGEADDCPNCGAELDRRVDDLEEKSRDLRQMAVEVKSVREERPALESGVTIADRFEVGEFVGRGPFGEVHRASDDITETDVALKVLDEDVIETPRQQQQFLDATRSARSMSQENVVRIHDSGVYEDHPWVSMQYLEGLTLGKTIELREQKGEGFDLEELEPVVRQLTLALQHIGREFPHVDLKPSNIFFLPDLLKVTDGYLAAGLPTDVLGERLSDSKYLAPEVREGSEAPDVRCDVYSLGVILGEMVFGREFEPADAVETTHPGLEELVQRATAELPEERYQSVEELSEDYSTLLDTGQLLEQVPAGERTGASDPADVGVEPQPDAPNSQFPEDEVATRDYEREAPTSGADPLEAPTTEMERDAGSTEEYEREAALDGGPTEEYERPDQSGRVRAGEELPPEPNAPEERPEVEEEGTSPRIFAVAVAALLAVVLGYWALSGEEQQEVSLDGAGSDAGATASADESAAGRTAVARAGEVVAKSVRRGAERVETEGGDRTEGSTPKRGGAGAGSGGGGDAGTSASAGAGEGPDDESSQGTAATGTGGSGSGEKPPPEGTNCPDRMALVETDSGNYCIDRYEYPGPGRQPTTNVTWFQAQSKCESDGKRLCTLKEFRLACGSPYPWGDEWNAEKCNTQDPSGFPRSLAASGEFKECRSWPGVYDMVGNAHEWVKEQMIAGGGYDSGKKHARCGNVSQKSAGTGTPTVGFRCCKDATRKE